MGIESSEGVVRFDGFELDVRTAELRSPAGKAVRLSEQPLRILIALLERPGDLVLRDDLRKRLWPNDTIVEFEHSINAAVNRLRQVLGDSADSPKFIETLARRGYRWKTQVQWVTSVAVPAAPEPRDGNLIGKRISHYRVLDILGGGGMGVVYKAEDIKLGRGVALKFLPEELAGDPAAMQRLEREARAASALNHPNICTIHGVEEHQGQPFIVMELLEGHTLRDVLLADTDSKSNSPFRLELLLDTALQIAHGLEAAHQKGIIHRDIKPANIFITNHGHTKILDFGLAKLHDFGFAESPPQPSAEPSSKAELNPLLTLTRSGVTVGTAAYMSPEQVRGERLDPRTDLFSFGLVLYEIATRQRAFPEDTAPLLRDAILNHVPVSVRELNPQVPPRLENIIRKALEKDCHIRYQTAADLTAELEALQRQLARKHLPLKWAVGLTLALVVVLVTIFLFAKRRPRTMSFAPEIKLRQLTTNSSENPVSDGSISPDGKYLAYSDTRGLHIKVIDSGETRVVPQPEGLPNQKVKLDPGPWFRDSIRFLVNAHPAGEFEDEWSSAGTSIWAVSVLGEAPTKIRDHAVVWSVSPDATTVSFGTNKGKRGEREIWLMGPNGEQARKFYEVSEDNAVRSFGWSADAKRNIYISTDASGDTMLSREVKGGPSVTLFQSSELRDIDSIVWLPDERVAYSVSESASAANYWTTRFNLNTGKRIEAPRRLTNWSNFQIYGGNATADGKRLTFVKMSSFSTAYIADLEGGGERIRNPRHFILEDSEHYIGDWTTDSKGVIVVEGRENDSSLYKQYLDSDSPHPIVSSIAGYVNYAVMTPDDKWVIALIWPKEEGRWLEHPSIPLQIVRIPIDGGVPEIVLQVSSPSPISCSRSPSNICVIAEQSGDHKQIVVSRFDPLTGRGPELGRFDFTRDVDAFVDNPICAISPNGTRLAITRSPESPVEIHSLRGQLMRIIPSRRPGKIIALRWAADQQGFFVTRRAADGTELSHLDLQGNENSLWRCFGSGWGCFASPSPDGRHVGILDSKKSTNMWMIDNF